MPHLRIGSRGSQLALWQANRIFTPLAACVGTIEPRGAKTIMGLFFSSLPRIRKFSCRDSSTAVLLKWGFGEYYQCGYWAALENRGSRLLAAARGSNPLLSACLRDLRYVKACLTREWFLTRPSSNGTFRLVLKRGSVSVFQGGLISRLSLLSNIPLGVAHHV